jgi:uncharacterized protein YbbC (DUF1343 family)
VKPSPNIATLTSALVYPALVAFEGTNVSVGRGTPTAFQRFGAPWMDAPRIAKMLDSLRLSGVSFVAESFTPDAPGDGKYAGRRIPGVRIDVTDRNRVQPGRISAGILWALNAAHRDSLRITALTFDLRFGAAALRTAILGGADPDAVIDSELQKLVLWQQKTRKYHLYR